MDSTDDSAAQRKAARPASTLATWSIRNPIPVIVLFLVLAVGGLAAFHALKVQNLPDIEIPAVLVTATLADASPSHVETTIARGLEDTIASVPSVRHVSTRVETGSALLTAQLRLEASPQQAVEDIRAAVARVRAELPSEMPEPIVERVDVSGLPLLAYAIGSTRMDPEALSWFVDQVVIRKLLAVKGVGRVVRVGGVSREISVELDPARLQGHGLTAVDIAQQLQQVQLEGAGGRADIGARHQSVRVPPVVQTADALAQLDVPLPDGRSVRLGDLATVRDGIAQPSDAAFLDGQPVVTVEIMRTRGASELQLAAGVQQALEDLRRAHPSISVDKTLDLVEPMAAEYRGSMQLLYEGAFLAVVVVWLFLRDARATLVSAAALPLSLLPAFIGMHLLGYSLNVVTLLALSLVVGLLVDDAIVEVENIVRHLRLGKTPYEAAMEAANEIGLAVVATTFALIAVFLPTAFMSGVVGRFFGEFGWTASIAVFASLVVARLLTPLMCAYLLKPIVGQAAEPGWMPRYLRWAAWCLRRRRATLLGAAGLFAASLALLPWLPVAFLPPDDSSRTEVDLRLPPGSTLQQVAAAAEQARTLLAPVESVKRIYATARGGLHSEASATLHLLLDDAAGRDSRQAVEARIRDVMQALPGVQVQVGTGGRGETYLLTLGSDDPQALAAHARLVERQLRSLPGVGHITSTSSNHRPELLAHADPAKAADLGVTPSSIAQALRIATTGDHAASLPKLHLSRRQVPIVVRLANHVRQDVGALEMLAVPGSRGPVVLAHVARLELTGAPSAIDRRDRKRYVQWEIELAGRPLGDVMDAVHALPSLQSLPPAIEIIELDDAEALGELIAGFGWAMLAGIAAIYLVLVLLFKNFLHPLTILSALPLSIAGAFVAMLAAGSSLSMSTLIGLLMLMGIATKNSILLVEYAVMARRDHGMSRRRALLDACRKRARPVVMTTVAMGAGMLPVALGLGGADSSFRAPMAIAVIGGLASSTVLSLLVVPAVYLWMDDFAARVRRRFMPKASTIPAQPGSPSCRDQ